MPTKKSKSRARKSSRKSAAPVTRYKNRLGGHTNSYHTYSLEEALEGIAAAGYKYVELSAVRGWTEHVPLDADEKTLGKIQRQLNRLGLVPVSLSGHSDLTTKDGLQLGLAALELCERLGIDIMNTAVGGHYSEEEDEAGFMGNINDLADAAAEKDITVGIEIHGDVTGTGERAAQVIRRIGRENIRLNYDTANAEFWGGVQPEQDLKYALPYLVHCHLKDSAGAYRVWNFPAIGKGHLDFANLLRQFKRAGYSGPFTVEIEFKGEPWPSLQAVNKAMKESYNALAALGLG
jgi:sugar phosphate isomerase/epimerase